MFRKGLFIKRIPRLLNAVCVLHLPLNDVFSVVVVVGSYTTSATMTLFAYN